MACIIVPRSVDSVQINDEIYVNQPVNIDNVIYISKVDEFSRELNDYIYKIYFKFRDGGRLEWWYLTSSERDEDINRDWDWINPVPEPGPL